MTSTASQSTAATQLSPLKQALLAIEKLQGKIKAMEAARSEPIAIVGMGCRFPGSAQNPEALWELLKNGLETLQTVPDDRWNLENFYAEAPTPGKSYTQQAHFVDRVDHFDAAFFDLSPREATTMDPQQRLLLEVAWESLEHAGIPAADLVGSKTGVFVGMNTSDYEQIQFDANNPDHLLNAYFFTGNTASVAAGRISHSLGFRGPALAVDTACSSSLVSLHLACQSLRAQDCDLALAGGVTLMIAPNGHVVLSQMRALAPDGRCKPFDASADGYGRGEGCGMVVLKRLSDAIEEGNSILAVVRGSAINHDGRSSGLTVPNGLAQVELLQAALDRSGVSAQQISYVELHGTGTPLGDPIEAEALAQVFGEARETPLMLGSVKANIGHLETAAGIAGIIKVVLALQNRQVPPNFHLREFNPALGWPNPNFDIPVDLTPWTVPEGQSRLAGVSSCGMSGTNVHAILEEAPASPETPAPELERPLHLLTFSAKSSAALQDLAGSLAQAIAASPATSLADFCFSSNTGRSHFAKRGAIVAASLAEMQQKLTDFVAEEKRDRHKTPLKTAFLFTGQGAQTLQMGQQLYQTSPLFRNILDRCNEILLPHLEQPLLTVLYPESEPTDVLLNRTLYAQPALFAIEYAIAQLWIAWGIEPDRVMGHSLGEYVAACVAGVFDLETGLLFVVQRARLMEQMPEDGAMAAVFADAETVRAAIASSDCAVEIATLNSPLNTVVSGAKAEIDTFTQMLTQQGIDCRALQVSRAFHSQAIEGILDAFREVAEGVAYQTPQIPIISNLTGETAAAEQLTQADYWCRHLRQPVNFVAGMQALAASGCRVMVEMGPHPVLLGLAKQCAGDAEHPPLFLPSLRRKQDDWSVLLESLRSLYLAGQPIAWQGFDRDYARQRLSLPTYPFQRQRYWFADQPETTPTATPLYTCQWQHVDTIDALPLSGNWLILGDRQQKLGERLGDRLTALGATPHLVYAEGGDAGRPEHLSPEDFAAFATLMQSQPWSGVVYLWGLDETEAPRDGQYPSCAGLFHLAKALAQNVSTVPCRLWIVTQNAQTPIAQDSLQQNLLWGLGTTIALEHPQQWGGLIDLPATLDADIITAIAAEISAIPPEDRIQLRTDGRYSQRLHTWQPSSDDPAFTEAGIYLITGGFGGLGLQLAQWLVQHGVRHLALLGRRSPSAEAEQVLQALEAQDVCIHRFQADISKDDDVSQVFTTLATLKPALKGVFHLAGVIDDGVLVQQQWERFIPVLQPKVMGAWHLHRHTESLALDTFVMFSSATAVLGSPSQGNYGAANAFLDSLAHLRRERGLPGLTVQWGPWAQSGMAAQLDERSQQRWNNVGVAPIGLEQGFDWLTGMVASESTPAIISVMPINWSRFQTQLPNAQRYTLIAELVSSLATTDSSWCENWTTISAAQRQNRLLECVKQDLAVVIGAAELPSLDPYTGFFELGLDSLMALELKNRLQTRFDLVLPTTLTFDYPTVAALVDYLLTQLAPPEDKIIPVFETTTDEKAEQELSESDLLELIDQEFTTWVK
ncbi:MAG: type I polyketide synthase [Cyanobacteria bacterium P01_G01_bin.54]